MQLPFKLSMKFQLSFCIGLAFLVPVASPQFTASPSNDASWRTSIAQGSLVKLAACQVGAPRKSQVASGFPLPRSLGGFAIQIQSGETTVQALILSANPSSDRHPPEFVDCWDFRAIIPSDTPLGNSQVRLEYNGRIGTPSFTTIWRRSLALYMTGPYQGKASNIDIDGNLSDNTFTNPARPGQSLVLWGTGLGPVDGDEAAGLLPGDLGVNGLEVLVGGKQARVLSAGRSDCCPGVDQILIETPRGIEGCHVPVNVIVPESRWHSSNYVAVSIASGSGECWDPHGWPASLLEKIRTEGSVSYGQFLSGLAIFSHVFGLAIPPFGTCSVVDLGEPLAGRTFYAENSGIGGPPISLPDSASPWIPVRPLDAGPRIRFNSPRGLLNIPRRLPGLYHTSPFPAWVVATPSAGPGEYVVDNGSGSANIPPFQFAVNTSPESFTTASRATFQAVKSSEGLLVTWRSRGKESSRDGSQEQGYVVMRGIVGYSGDIGPGFVCVERASQGSLLIPENVMRNTGWPFIGLDFRYEIVFPVQVPGLDLAEFVHSN
jgi:uncharacterized protein (TIGR03437 family)